MVNGQSVTGLLAGTLPVPPLHWNGIVLLTGHLAVTLRGRSAGMDDAPDNADLKTPLECKVSLPRISEILSPDRESALHGRGIAPEFCKARISAMPLPRDSSALQRCSWPKAMPANA